MLAVRATGDEGGTPVLLHPSLGRPASDFDALAVRLAADGFRCLAVDPRGISATGGPPPPPDATLHDLAADALAVLDHYGIAAAHLVGHALGNRVMRCLSADHPERARSVVLLAAGGRHEGDDESRAALIGCFDERRTDEDHLDSVRTAFFAPGNEIPDDWRTGWFPEAAAAQGAAVGRTPTEDWWSGGAAPMLVVQGLQDRIAPPANGRDLLDRGRARHLVEIDGAGHALLPEQPGAVADAVRASLTDLSLPPSPRTAP